tara:strand:+ start:908 stop:1303 length:396 start_codon:yes stop_codon:yes gene_type:complete
MIRYDEVGSLSNKLSKFIFTMDIKVMLILLACLGIITILFGYIRESIITAQTVMILIISSMVMYVYFKKQYSHKIKKLKLKNKILKKNSILEEVCNTERKNNVELCSSYDSAKTNFYTISNMLLQKYNIND